MRKIYILFIVSSVFSANAFALTYTVTNTSDALIAGSLRTAITNANATAANDNINFTIGTATITLTGALPTINGASGGTLTIDGGGTANTALTGALNGTLAVTINGGGLTLMMQISSDGNIIRGLNFMMNTAAGGSDKIITITAGADNNQILGCYLGTTLAGTGSANTGVDVGVRITDAANNKIGDGTAAGRNLINGIYSILIEGASATGNTLKGNIFGLNKNGTTDLYTGGLGIISLATGNTIGGTGAGDGNVISSCSNWGIYLGSTAVAGNSVLGNIIGLQADGTSYVASNTQTYGIYITNSPNNIIGDGTVAGRNIISANETRGVYITGAGSTGNRIKGNYIGLDKNGTTFIAGNSQDYGVLISSSAASNIIGGTGTGEGNVISGNSDGGGISSGYGVYLNSTAAAGNTVLGNIIGPQQDGTSNVASNDQTWGIIISDSPNNTIGGNTSGARNIISANLDYGVWIGGTVGGSTGNIVKGNYIGLDITGTTFIASSSQDYGVYFAPGNDAASNTIGGTTAGEGNVISGNISQGIYLGSTAVAGNSVLGNIIGPQANGTSNVAANAQTYGVGIVCPNNTIGGSAAGARNIISANTSRGIWITGAAATGNLVRGNYIGLDQNGTTFIAGSDQDDGVYIDATSGSPAGNTIGGTVAGERNVISGNINSGVYFASTAAAGNTVLGNIIGPQENGTSNVTSNAQTYGVYITGSPNNIIGGTAALAKNIISANLTNGVSIRGAGSTGNLVKGNYIGLDQNGTTFIASSSQGYGVSISTSAASNTIGGTGAGEGNVISGNSSGGIFINSTATAGNSILGNIIGPQANGTSYVSSNIQNTGIYVSGTGTPNTIIGGSTAGARNIISANVSIGVHIDGSTSTGNLVKGNYIGLGSTGTTLIAGSSQTYGVYINGGFAASNIIGGSGAGEGNVISGNSTYGVYIIATAAGGNTVVGNIIGPQANGTSNVTSNAQTYGVYISGSPNNTIGGTAPLARNIISANLTYGVYISGAGSTGNVVKGNYIGLDQNGTTFITSSSQDYGVYINTSAESNTIGGTATGEGNVISGNSNGALGGRGIGLFSSAAAGNSVLGNIIGPQANGTSYVASNAQDVGIWIQSSPANIIGGNTAGARNIISANLTNGIRFEGANGNFVKGNYIGIDKNGTTFIAGSDQNWGVFFATTSASNTIGGTVAGEGNVISGNTDVGIRFVTTTAVGNSALGNIIGPQANGTSDVAANSQDYGVYISISPNNTIGGSAAGARNIVSSNLDYGIYITGAGSTGNLMKGNYIGLDQNGTTFIASSSQDYGVFFSTAAANNTIGGTGAGEGNVISGNTATGIYFAATGVASNSVLGNIIGPQANGTSNVALNAQTFGVIVSSSPNNTIGGSSAGARNIISANLDRGIYITGAISTGNLVKGNYIGAGSALASIASSNQDYGVYIVSSAANNTIGGSVAGEANTIAFNTVQGVYLTGASTDFNLISRNPIYSNGTPIGTGKPINLNYAGGSNNNKAIPVITTANTTTIGGTSGAGDIVEVFMNSTGNCNDAVTFVGAATANGAGNWSLAVALAASDYVFATATDASKNTSEFNPCVVPLPVELLSFSAMCKGSTVQLSWTTASETNNHFFTIERSADAKNFTPIGTVKGAGNSSTTINYPPFVDNDPINGTAYYRLRQTDFNGTSEVFSPVSVSCSGNSGFSVTVNPNPISNGNIYVSVNGAADENVLVVLTDVLGREKYSKIIVEQSDGYLFNINLQDKIAPGVYFVIASSNDKYFSKKIVVK